MEKNFMHNSFIGLQILKASEISLDLQNESCLMFLKHLHSLEELDLSRNMEYGVEMLPAIFAENELHSLQRLSLSLCRIKDINPHAFIGLNNLREMDLSRNYLTRVPRALNRLALLRRLNLRENDITVIYHGDFNEINCLEELDLSKNLLGQMEAFRYGALFGIGNSLQTLILKDSHLSLIPTKAISELKKLNHLDISDNMIIFMNNESFKGAYKLTHLDISGNPWLIDNDMFDSVKDTLVTMRMRKMGLTFLPRIPLQRLNALRTLDVSNNDLMYINNETVSGITARRLSFQANRIRYVSADAFAHYRRPIDLDLSMNILDSLDFVFNSEKCTYYKLNISNNGFLCDCQIENLVNSKRIHSLVGNCILKTGELVSLSNESMTRDLERHCGTTEESFCLWWVPKSNARASKDCDSMLKGVLNMIYLCLLILNYYN
jgi:Leucine-rich repeat (LRR) protein